MAGVGNYIDSFFEYLLKGYILFHDVELLRMFTVSYNGAMKHLEYQSHLVTAHMHSGQQVRPSVDSLQVLGCIRVCFVCFIGSCFLVLLFSLVANSKATSPITPS